MILMRLSKALQVINLGYCLDHEVEIRSHIEEALRAFLLLHDTIMKTKLRGTHNETFDNQTRGSGL